MKINDICKKHINVLSPGFVVEILQNKVVQEITIGNLSYDEDSKEVNTETLYDIASLTKTFTAVLIFMAIEENLCSLDSNIFQLNNNFINLKDVSILDLLSHRKEIWTNGYLGDAKNRDEYYKILYTAFVKNNIRKYVDVHYIILSFLLESIYNKSFDCLVNEKIKKTLNLKSLTFDAKTQNIASTNFENRDSMTVIDDVRLGLIHDTKARVAKKHGIFTGHASIFINGIDMLKFLESFFDYSLLKKETIDLMLKHDDINAENHKLLKTFNVDYEKNPAFYMPRTINYMGVRYRNDIFVLNDIPLNASDRSITFSGYTGPVYFMDFKRQIIILIMCNTVHKNTLNRKERKKITEEMVEEIFETLI